MKCIQLKSAMSEEAAKTNTEAEKHIAGLVERNRM